MKVHRVPTCAATVCDLVGKSFVMHAVLNPLSDNPMAALKPAPPAPTTMASYVWSTSGYDCTHKPAQSIKVHILTHGIIVSHAPSQSSLTIMCTSAHQSPATPSPTKP